MTFVQGNPLENIDDTINVRKTMVNGILRTVEDIIAPFPTTGNGDRANQASLANAPEPKVLPPVPNPPENDKYWWAKPKWVKDDFNEMMS
jgi:hypothetical protein